MTDLDQELAALRSVSARIGIDPMFIQAAGGNTSIKDGDVMWIKASGTQLREAETAEIFVSVNLPEMRASLRAGEARADQPAAFLTVEGGLRPSIETSLHAVFSQAVVMHAHCVHTLAYAVQSDCEMLLKGPLSGLDWALVPYVKPGANLAGLVADVVRGTVDVVVLQNHGIIVAGDNVAATDAKLRDVHERLRIAPAPSAVPDVEALQVLIQGSEYTLPDYTPLHQLALNDARLKQATGGSLYPDHVLFCGIGATAIQPGETPDAAALRVQGTGAPAPVFLIAPGAGVVVRKDASDTSHALMRCLADVLIRVPGTASLGYLSPAQNHALLDWDAEKYRASLNA